MWSIFQVALSLRFARKRDKDLLRTLALSQEDLPASKKWTNTSEIFFRTGAGTSLTEELQRARKERSTTCKRIWKTVTETRIVSSWVVPFASEADARVYLPIYMQHTLRKPFSRNTTIREGYVDVVSDLSRAALHYQIEYETPDGSSGERLLIATVGRYLLCLDFWERGQFWTWDDAAKVVTRQAKRIAAQLASS